MKIKYLGRERTAHIIRWIDGHPTVIIPSLASEPGFDPEDSCMIFLHKGDSERIVELP